MVLMIKPVIHVVVDVSVNPFDCAFKQRSGYSCCIILVPRGWHWKLGRCVYEATDDDGSDGSGGGGGSGINDGGGDVITLHAS